MNNTELISYDCRDYTAEEIIDLLLDVNYELKYDRTRRKRVYVGATSDVKSRARDHNITVDDIFFCAQTTHQKVAAKVERLAKEAGFNIGNVSWGGNGTNSKSLYVYAYVITRKTVQ